MKRGICVLMVLAVLLGCFPMCTAAMELSEEKYDVDAYYAEVYEKYDLTYGAFGTKWDTYYKNDEGFVYVLADQRFDSYNWLGKSYINMAIAAINGVDLLDAGHSLENAQVQYYEVALLSLLKTMEQDLLTGDNSAQAGADQTMNAMDYLLHTAQFAANLAGIPEMDGIGKGVQYMISAVDASMSICDSALGYCQTQDDYDKLSRMSQVFTYADMVLEAIEDYPNQEQSESIGYLKIAAANVRQGMQMSLAVNLHKFNSFLEPSAEAVGSYLFSDVLGAVTEADIGEIFGTVADESMECLAVVAKAASAFSGWSAGVEIGVYACDLLIGSSDTLLRYHEIRAMAGVRKALLYQGEKLHKKIDGPEDCARIGEFGKYLYALLYVSMRGEYCVYQLQKSDAKLLTLMVNGDSLETWHKNMLISIESMKADVSRIFPNPEHYLLEDTAADDGIPASYAKILDQYTQALHYCRQFTDSVEIGDDFPDFGDINTSIPLNTLDGMGLPGPYTDIGYVLFDINSDGTEELLIGGIDEYSGMIRFGDIFTLEDSRAVRLCQAEDFWFGGLYVYEGGLIVKYNECGQRYDWFYNFDSGGKLEYLGGFLQSITGEVRAVDSERNVLDETHDATEEMEAMWDYIAEFEQWSGEWTLLE